MQLSIQLKELYNLKQFLLKLVLYKFQYQILELE